MKTNVVRISLSESSGSSLSDRIENVCTIQHAAGFDLITMTSVGDQLLLIFQKDKDT